MIEFALTVPLLLTMIFFSLYFCELVHARLTLQEASRFAAWEMTSYPLDDYSNGSSNDNDGAFTIAQKDVTDRTKKMFVDMDSVEPGTGAATNFFASYTPVDVKITAQKVGQKNTTVQMGALGSLVGMANRGLGSILGFWGFNPKGVVQVDVSTSMNNLIVPQHFLEKGQGGFFKKDQWGGVNLKGLKLHNRFTLVASSWALGDGGDMNAGDDIAGSSEDDSPSAMWYQVKRMSFLGLSNKLENLPGVKQITGGLSKLLPNLLGTYVVDHAYRHNGLKGYRQKGTEDHECDQNPKDPALSGMTNVEDSPGLDFEYGKCFDTLPFRDRQGYNQSMYVQMFNHRGQYFMGCMNPEVDEPSWPTLDLRGDKDNRQPRLDCEVPPP